MQRCSHSTHAVRGGGNLLSDSAYTYAYNTARAASQSAARDNRLTAVNASGLTIGYTYNGLGDRLSQFKDGVTTHHTLDLNAGLTQVLQDGTNTYLYGVNRIAQVAGTQTGYFLPDALGSVRQMTDAYGDITLTQSYTPYGEVLYSKGTAATDYAFTGESYDPQTGLVYLRARY